MRSWKTTLAGLFIILGVLGKDMKAGKIDPITDATAIAGAVGLLNAKDNNVTGGTVAQ